jgi:uncharacterized membrane protein YqiK
MSRLFFFDNSAMFWSFGEKNDRASCRHIRDDRTHDGFAIPIFHKVARVKTALRRISCDCEVRSEDNEVLQLNVAAIVRVNPTQEDFLQAWHDFGDSVNDDDAVISTFRPRIVEALVARALYTASKDIHARDDFKESVILAIGVDLGGFVLDDLSIESVTSA